MIKIRVCDICHDGSNIQIVDCTSENEDVEWDMCSGCISLLMTKDWMGLAAKSGAGLVEDQVKKGTAWVTEFVLPKVMDYVRDMNIRSSSNEPIKITSAAKRTHSSESLRYNSEPDPQA